MSDETFVLTVLVVVAIVATGFAWPYRRQFADLIPAYIRLAQGRQGKATRGPSFKRLSFQRHGAKVLVDTWFAKECIQLQIDWPRAGSRMTINSRRLPRIIGRLIGITDIRIGDRAFDKRYTVVGNDAQAIREMLSPLARGFIDALQNLADNHDLHIGICGGRYVVQKLGRFHEFEELVQFISRALALYEHLLRRHDTGIEFIEPFSHTPKYGDQRIGQRVICQVCGGPIRSDVVFCRSCRTPHHLDCWQYYGACSTYGCRHTQFVSNIPARRRGVAS